MNENDVKVVDIDIKFGSLIWLMIKCAFAIIPATIVVTLIYLFVTMFLAAALTAR